MAEAQYCPHAGSSGFSPQHMSDSRSGVKFKVTSSHMMSSRPAWVRHWIKQAVPEAVLIWAAENEKYNVVVGFVWLCLLLFLPLSEKVFLETNLGTWKVQLDKLLYSHTCCFHRKTDGKFWALLVNFGVPLPLVFKELQESQLYTWTSVPHRSRCIERSAFHYFSGSCGLTNMYTRQSNLNSRYIIEILIWLLDLSVG